MMATVGYKPNTRMTAEVLEALVDLLERAVHVVLELSDGGHCDKIAHAASKAAEPRWPHKGSAAPARRR